jgi:hypothetical protein
VRRLLRRKEGHFQRKFAHCDNLPDFSEHAIYLATCHKDSE